MTTTIYVPREYGYVIATGIATAFLSTYLGIKVTGFRKEAGVPYPYLYAEKSEAEKDVKKHTFNCYQRAHQNMLESYPQTLFMLAVGGIRYPIIASIGGLIWIAGRIAYANGYYSGEPQKRSHGRFGYLGVITLLGVSIATSVNLLFG
ncbi:hypothetical protein G9A89_019268 [Geosiphon pyriformis]|nr:hypothetical protein G9A89_019268 [Geosiphon pyriformis]